VVKFSVAIATAEPRGALGSIPRLRIFFCFLILFLFLFLFLFLPQLGYLNHAVSDCVFLVWLAMGDGCPSHIQDVMETTCSLTTIVYPSTYSLQSTVYLYPVVIIQSLL
jgi:hypothetical protein